MQSLLCAGPIWGGIQQASWRVQPNAAPVQPPTSMRVMFSVFRLQNLCWILMFVLDTYVRAWDLWDLCSWYLCLCWELGYLCLCWIFMSVMISVMYICDICDDICDTSFVCLDGIEKTNKKGVYWSLCRVLHSVKRGFAECQDHITRQRTKTWAPI